MRAGHILENDDRDQPTITQNINHSSVHDIDMLKRHGAIIFRVSSVNVVLGGHDRRTIESRGR